MSGSNDPWAAFNPVALPDTPQPPPDVPQVSAADPWAVFTPQRPTGPASQWIPNAMVEGAGSVVGFPHAAVNLIGAGTSGLARGVGAAADFVGAPGVAEGARGYAAQVDRGREVATRHLISPQEGARGLRTSLGRMGVDVPDVQAESPAGRVAADAIAGATSFALTPGMAGVGGLVANAGLGAASGLASGAAREVGFGPTGQMIAGVAVPVGIMGAASVANNRGIIRAAEEALRGLRPEQRTAINTEVPRLMAQAEAQGVPITWAEAVQRTIGQPIPALDAIQAVATSSRGGGPIMSEMDVRGMSAAREQLQRVTAAQDPGPSALAGGRPQQFRAGSAIKRESDAEIAGIKAVEDDIATALYDAADARVMQDPNIHRQVSQVVRASYAELQQLAQTSPLIAPHAERMLQTMLRGGRGSWTEFNAARRELRDSLDAMADGQRAVPGEVARQARPIIDRLTQNLEAVVPEFGAANREYAAMMRNVVEPLRDGTLGKLAGTADLDRQSRLLMENRIPGETGDVVRRIAGQGSNRAVVDQEAPALARALLHRELETRLEPILKAKGPSPEAFANMTQTERANLREMFRAQPGGDRAWEGFNRLLETLESVRYRPRTGSRSEAAMQQATDAVQTGPIRATTNPVGWYSDMTRRLAMDLNTRAIAQNLVSPEGYARLSALASVRNPRVQAALVRSIIAAGQVEPDEGAP